MTKRILGLAVAAVVLLGVAGASFAAAASPAATSTGLDEVALALAADPAPPAAKGEELRACVKAKVDGGVAPKAARQECATQLGIDPAKAGKAGRPGKGDRLRARGRAAHVERVVPKKGAEGWETVVLDRGKVTAASADSLSVQRPDGPTVTVKVVAGTKVRGAASVAELAVGREVAVVSVGGEARAVVARP